jgi:hypothetical protein
MAQGVDVGGGVNVGWVVTVEVGVNVPVEVAVSVALAVVVIEVVGVALATTGFGWRSSDALAEVNSKPRVRARSRQAVRNMLTRK